jgi:hypothetical protein
MADGDQPGKSQQKVQAHDRYNGNEDIVQHQHVLVADFKEQGPPEQKDQKTGEYGTVQVGEKGSLFLFVGGEKISCG